MVLFIPETGGKFCTKSAILKLHFQIKFEEIPVT